MKHCRTSESLKMRRITPKFGRLSNVSTVASVETVPPIDLALTIRQIVREKLLRCQQIYHRPSNFQDVYVNEPERVRTPVSLPPWQPSINTADAYEYQGTRQAGFPRHLTPNYERSFRPPVHPTSPAYSAPEGRHHYPMPSERSRYSEQPRTPRPIPLPPASANRTPVPVGTNYPIWQPGIAAPGGGTDGAGFISQPGAVHFGHDIAPSMPSLRWLLLQGSAFTCSWPVTGPRPCLDKLTIPSRRLPGHADTIRAPVRPQAGPPGPFKSTKWRGAALTLTRRACTSTMQSPAQHSTPTTTDALSVSLASSGRTTDTAVPPLSTSGKVTSPAPTTIQQQAAFLNSAHGPATCNAGGVSAALSLIATQTPERESRNAALALQSTTPAALPTLSASGLPIGNSKSVDKRVSTSVVHSIAEVLPSITSADDLSTEMDFTASQVNEDNTPSPEGSCNTVSANRKPASTARPRSELITVGIQLPLGTLTPKLPLYDLLSTIIAAANLSLKTSAEVTLQAKSAQSLVFLKTHSPLTAHLLLSLTSLELNGTVLINAPNTAFRPSASAVRLLYQQIPMLTFAPNPGASIAKSTPTHLSTPPAPTF
ncbi:hypothetical protein HPB51_010352 [Rhipicephalus microplus]|uniref:Uncharacterized protein n=1 Tax=Rhipicephalus microplus TaxID=6941 RepID=A0A9J6DU01_RHIMP|nr:hypothetical protein HPB51_010352 [Rhipicephalus microplus]